MNIKFFNILILLFFISPFSSSAGMKESDTQITHDSYVMIIKKKYSNGNKKNVEIYENKKKVQEIIFFKNGDISYKKNFISDTIYDFYQWNEYNKKIHNSRVFNYQSENKYYGSWTYYYSNGNLKKQAYYNKNFKGKVILWYKNGIKHKEFTINGLNKKYQPILINGCKWDKFGKLIKTQL